MNTDRNDVETGGLSSNTDPYIPHNTGSSQECSIESREQNQNNTFTAQKLNVHTDTYRIDSLENYMGGQLSHLIHEISSLGQTVKSVNDQFKQKLDSLDNGLLKMQARVSELENPDPEVNFNLRPVNTRMPTHSQVSRQSNMNSQNNINQNMAPEMSYFPLTAEMTSYGYNSFTDLTM